MRVAPSEKRPQRAPLPFPPRGDPGEDGRLQSMKRTRARHQIGQSFHLGFQPPELSGRNKCLLWKPPPVSGILLQQLKQTKTVCKWLMYINELMYANIIDVLCM